MPSHQVNATFLGIYLPGGKYDELLRTPASTTTFNGACAVLALKSSFAA